MKKKLYISTSVIFLGLAILFGANYLLSLHTITFSLADKIDSAIIYTSHKQKIGTISAKEKSLTLRTGAYYAVPEGNNISHDSIDFSVENKNKTITLNPPYTDEYLASLLDSEESKINAALANKYPSIISTYTLKRATLYDRGEWAGGLLAPQISDIRQQKDPYRVVLHKKDGVWEIIRRPEYILASSKYDEVPITILRAVNSLVE